MNAISAPSAAALTTSPDLGTLSSSLSSNDAQAKAQAARDFEGVFLSLLLKEMRSTLEQGGLFGGDNSDVQGGLFDYFMGQSLAESGGVGLARFLQTQMQLSKAAP
jgi:flagellar protein FlgJ